MVNFNFDRFRPLKKGLMAAADGAPIQKWQFSNKAWFFMRWNCQCCRTSKSCYNLSTGSICTSFDGMTRRNECKRNQDQKHYPRVISEWDLPGSSISIVSFFRLNGSVEEFNKCLVITWRSMMMPLGRRTGFSITVSIRGSKARNRRCERIRNCLKKH